MALPHGSSLLFSHDVRLWLMLHLQLRRQLLLSLLLLLRWWLWLLLGLLLLLLTNMLHLLPVSLLLRFPWRLLLTCNLTRVKVWLSFLWSQVSPDLCNLFGSVGPARVLQAQVLAVHVGIENRRDGGPSTEGFVTLPFEDVLVAPSRRQVGIRVHPRARRGFRELGTAVLHGKR